MLNHLFDLTADLERIMSEAQLANICSNSTIKIPEADAVAQRCSVKKMVLKIYPKACSLIKKEAPALVFSCEFC